MLKKLIEGNELLNTVPACKTTGRGPIVKLQHNLILDDGNCFESPTLLMGNVGRLTLNLLKTSRMWNGILLHKNRRFVRT